VLFAYGNNGVDLSRSVAQRRPVTALSHVSAPRIKLIQIFPADKLGNAPTHSLCGCSLSINPIG
jgi:hypothetical protein